MIYTLDRNLFSLLIKLGNCIMFCSQLIYTVKIMSDIAFTCRNWFIIFINLSEMKVVFDYFGSNRALSSPRKLRVATFSLCMMSAVISLTFNSLLIYILRCAHHKALPFILNRTTMKWDKHHLHNARQFSGVLQFILRSTLPLIILCVTAIFIMIRYLKRIDVSRPTSRNYYFEGNEVVTKTVIGLNINCLIFQIIINIATFISHFISSQTSAMYYSSIFVAEIFTIVQGNFNAAIYAYVHTPFMYDHLKDLKFKQIHLQNL